MIRIVIQRAVDHPSIPTDATLKKWIRGSSATYEHVALTKQHAHKWHLTPAEVTLRIVDKTEMTELNHRYRGKNYPTNVLSFPIESTPLVGDIVVCADVVAEEAAMQHKPLAAHWAHMVVHGCLHLLGYDHVKAKEAVKMESLEISILKEQGFDNPYKENNRHGK